jgi:hypothetical protein
MVRRSGIYGDTSITHTATVWDIGQTKMTTVAELFQWLLSIDRAFAFLLALPLIVGAVGLIAEYARRIRHKRRGTLCF